MRKYNTAWGCDLCQSSCPYNREPIVTPIEFFHRERIHELTRDILDSMDKPTFLSRAFAWRGRKTVERNLDILK
jgi:epoxyqueuosine reductase QueG